MLLYPSGKVFRIIKYKKLQDWQPSEQQPTYLEQELLLVLLRLELPLRLLFKFFLKVQLSHQLYKSSRN